jgi:hypothetical protein
LRDTFAGPCQQKGKGNAYVFVLSQQLAGTGAKVAGAGSLRMGISLPPTKWAVPTTTG